MRAGGQGKGIAIGIVVVLILIIVGVCFARGAFGGSGAEKAATAFFQSNADEGAAIAYDRTAPTFHDVTPEATWANTSRQYNLGSFTGANWTQRDAEGDLTTVRGKLHLAGNADLPVVVDLRRIGGIWKVSTVAFQAADESSTQIPTPSLPSDSAASSIQSPQQAGNASLPNGQPGGVIAAPNMNGAPAAPTAAPPASFSGAPAAPVAAAPTSSDAAGNAVIVGSQMEPICMSALAAQGFAVNRVDCRTGLAAKPGAQQLCYAHVQDGRTLYASVTYGGYDPVTRQSRIDCRMVD
jgi:hypothetical protein